MGRGDGRHEADERVRRASEMGGAMGGVIRDERVRRGDGRRDVSTTVCGGVAMRDLQVWQQMRTQQSAEQKQAAEQNQAWALQDTPRLLNLKKLPCSN